MRDKTHSIMLSPNVVAMERQLKALNSEVDKVDTTRWRKIKQSKFEKGEEPDAVAKWGEDIDVETSTTDEMITKLRDVVNEVRSNQIVKDREIEHTLKEKERKEQLAFEKQQFETEISVWERIRRMSQSPRTRSNSGIKTTTQTQFQTTRAKNH